MALHCVYRTVLLLLVVCWGCRGLRVRSEFNQRGVRGTIEFSQDSPSDATVISVNLTGLSQHNQTGNTFPWHVHEYPIPLNGLPNPCRGAIAGGHYDPLGASLNTNYTQDCGQSISNCEIGDLSGKFGGFNVTDGDLITMQYEDPTLSLFGVYSIIGRSIVIHFTNTERLVCANVDYPESSDSSQDDILYTPFRNQFAGAIYFRGHTDAQTSSVYTNLIRVIGNSTSNSHNWHVHLNPLDVNGTDCGLAGPHYNPLNADTASPNYTALCTPTMQENCEIGDLSNKGAPFDVVDGTIRHFYTDTILPLVGGTEYIVNRSIVIHAENRGGPRISCANITKYNPLEAVVRFNEAGIMGTITFSQVSPFDPTSVLVDLQGLGGIAGGYHVHINPVPPEGEGRCSLAAGHWNPTNIMYDSDSTPLTSDQYEIGDLSGKFGPLNGLSTISETYSDPNVPLFGLYSIVGRSVVIHRQDDGSRITCSNIELVRPVVQVVTLINTTSLRGRIVFSQPLDDPFAETTIIIELEVLQVINVTAQPLTPSPTQSLMIQTSSIRSSVQSMGIVSTSVMVASNSSSLLQQTISASQTSQPVPMPSSSIPMSNSSVPMSSTSIPMANDSVSMSATVGSGSGDMSMDIQPIQPTTTVSTMLPTPSPGGQSRRRRRQAPPSEALFDWSVRSVGGESVMGDCNMLPIAGDTFSDIEGCDKQNPQACAIGDLTGKHGPIAIPTQPGPFRAVFTDPSLPLSGPASPFNQPAALLVQAMGAETSTCALAEAVEAPAPPTMATTGPTEPDPTIADTTQETTDLPAPVGTSVGLIGGVVGGVVGGVLLIAVVLLLIVVCCVCSKRRSKYKLSDHSALELGTVRPAKPILGVPSYRALHDYQPQSEDDLKLERGEWVTLVETPLGGNWWKGSVEGRSEGWFPRTYVEYVDVEAEKKRMQEENFLKAASAIVAASSSFNAQHPSLTQTRHQTMPVKTKRAFSFSKKKEEKIDLEMVQRSATVSRKLDIDSTPRAPRKLDKPYLEDGDEINPEATVISNAGGEVAANGNSIPGTPVSQRNTEIYVNTAAQDSPTLRNSNQASENGVSVEHQDTTVADSQAVSTDKYIVKYDFIGSTDIELELRKGSLVTVVEKSDGGWWKGVCEERVGWFPESYIRPAPLEASHEMSPPPAQPSSMEEMMKTGGDLEAFEYRSIFPYQSETEGDLVFGEGATVLVYWAQDNGWWYGEVDSALGWFPGSFVEPAIEKPEEDDKFKDSGRSSFRKMWSLRKKPKTKAKDTEKLLEAEGSQPDEPVGLEGQADVGSESPKKAGPQKSRAEMISDFMRKSFKRSKNRDEPKAEEKVEESPKPEQPTLEASAAPEVPETKPKGSKSPPRKRLESKARRAPPPPPSVATPTVTTPTLELKESVIKELVTEEANKDTALKTDDNVKPPSPKIEPIVIELKPASPKKEAVQSSNDNLRTGRSHSTAQGSQPRPQPRKRLRTAGGAQRRPPPAPPSGARPAPASTDRPSAVTTSTIVEEGEDGMVRPKKIPPVPPRSALRPRMQRVKRPVSRMIPPPPSIPLPPPPTRRTTEPKVTTTEPKVTTTDHEVPAIEPAPVSSAEKRKSIDKPPVAPKPANLRKLSAPSPTTSTPPDSEPVKSPRTPNKPKPPPPTRTSSLAGKPVPPRRNSSIPTSPLTKIEDTQQEETDSPQAVMTEDTMKVARSAPPRRPPPPQPAAVAAKRNSRIEEEPQVTGAKVLYSATDLQPVDDGVGHAIKTKSSSLMRSLKKIVTRDSRRGSEKGLSKNEDDKESPETKPKEAPVVIAATQNGSPKPKPRTKISDTSIAVQDPTKGRPARPPPPKTPPLNHSTPPLAQRQVSNSEETKEEVVSRPVPLPRQTSLATDTGAPLDPPAPKSTFAERAASPDTNFYKAVKDYKAQAEKELSFSKGDVLVIVNKGDNGFHFGMLDDGTTGLFPIHAVEPFLN